MDKVQIQKDLFLGVPELDALINFPENYNNAFFGGIISNFGIFKNDTDVSFDNMKVFAGSLSNTISIKLGRAIDSSFKLMNILSDIVDVYTIPSDSIDRYVMIFSNESYIEEGTISISSTGQITGIGTDFTNKFRVGNYPTIIEFVGSSNIGTYEIASVTSDTIAQLVGTNFIVESAKQFKILGTFTQGQVITNKELYKYDKYTIAFSTTNTAVSQSIFCLAKVKYTGSVRTITDLRSDFLKLNINAVYDYLSAANNLSDLTDKAIARKNLNVYSKSETLSSVLASAKILVGNGSNVATPVSMSNDATMSNTGAVTLATVATPGTYKSVTVDAKGRITSGTNPTTITDFGITDVYTWARQASKPTYTNTEVGLPLVANVLQWSSGNHPTTISGYGITDSIIYEGDYRLTNARNASDVYPWAKQVSKPSYSYEEVGISYYYATFGNFTLNVILVGRFKVITISFSGDTDTGVQSESITPGYAPIEGKVNVLTSELDVNKPMVVDSAGIVTLIGTPSTTVYASATYIRLS